MQNGEIQEALLKLDGWVERSNWMAYDTFDGLSSPYARVLTFNHPLLKRIWQQAVRRFPINLRPVLGIKPRTSTKAMGFFAQGYLRLYQTHGDPVFLEKLKFCLRWLVEHRSAGFKGYCWGNHFDYQSRGGNIPKGTPTIVWTGLIAHAFLDAYQALGEEQYFAVARSACDFILDELGWIELGEGVCLRYYPNADILVHNSSMIGASLLARVNSLAANPRYREMAERAIQFTLHHQTAEGAWHYGVGSKWAWVDSFHTGYVLEALHIFTRCTSAKEYEPALKKGFRYFVETFFEADGTPRYYAEKTLPIDIQCASQAIQTLVNLHEFHPESVTTAVNVANWTILNMQDKTGYFYYRKYPLIINKTPMLHWGQATMFAALALFDQYLNSTRQAKGKTEQRANGSSSLMKTVLLICNRVPHYRVSVYNYLHRRFLECGWEFKVASDGTQRESKLQLKFDFRETEFKFWKYRQLINEIRPDVVILHLHLKHPVFWALIHWLKLKGVPIVSWTKGANLDRPDSKLRYHLFNYAHSLSDALILYTSRQTDCIKHRNRRKVFAANNTVNFEDYPEVEETKEQIKAEFGIPFEKVVLFVGTMGVDGERKKVDHLIEIFHEFDRPDVGLVLVGNGMSEDRKAKLNPKNTIYLGQIHDTRNLQISKLFKAADIFVVPGHVGLGLNQAFYWGLPAVTEDCRQPPEIQYLKPGRNGFLVAENDLAALKEKMLYLLGNEAVRAEFSRHAREDILEDASIEGMFLGFRKAVEFAYRSQL